jgi:hypothetical protein
VSGRPRFPGRPAALLVLAIAAAALVAAVAWYIQQLNVYKADEETYHFDMGRRFRHAAGARIRVTDDGAFLTEPAGGEYPLGTNPVFFAGEDRAVLTASFLAVTGDGRQGRVPYFSELLLTEEGPVLFDGKKEIPMDGGFLFDGVNTYLFLEAGTLVCGDKAYPLTPGTSVTVVYSVRAELYPYNGDAGLMIDTVGPTDVTALLEGGYSADLGKDILRYDNTEMLLFTDPEMIAPLTN